MVGLRFPRINSPPHLEWWFQISSLHLKEIRIEYAKEKWQPTKTFSGPLLLLPDTHCSQRDRGLPQMIPGFTILLVVVAEDPDRAVFVRLRILKREQRLLQSTSTAVEGDGEANLISNPVAALQFWDPYGHHPTIAACHRPAFFVR